MEKPHVVEVKQGSLEGFKTETPNGSECFNFLGIPYAEPPLGNLRFKAPVPKKPWPGVRQAKAPGFSCSQIDIVTKSPAGEEDCLFLNVYTPKLGNQNYPVMVNFHGGGFVVGSSDQCSCENLIENGVVYVSVNYRLNVLGFLCLDIPDAPGNAGLKDQTLSLKWIKENIQYFGGDPNNVTIFGISAGSASVEYHLLSPLSKDLFQKAILQSGSTLNSWCRTRDPSHINKILFKKLSIDENQPPEKILQELQKIDAGTLVRESQQVIDEYCERNSEVFQFVTVVEKPFPGAFIDKEPVEILKSGHYNHVPTIVGFCENEGYLFRFFYTILTEDLHQRKFNSLFPKYLKANDDRLKKLYIDNFENTEESIDAFLSDLYFIGGIYTAIKLRLNFGDEIYLYKFQYEGNINFVKIKFGVTFVKGALHGDDTSYIIPVVETGDSKASKEDLNVRNNMTKLWTNYAKYTNPTPEKSGLLKWNPIKGDNWNMLTIDKELNIEKFNWHERGQFWEEANLGDNIKSKI